MLPLSNGYGRPGYEECAKFEAANHIHKPAPFHSSLVWTPRSSRRGRRGWRASGKGQAGASPWQETFNIWQSLQKTGDIRSPWEDENIGSPAGKTMRYWGLPGGEVAVTVLFLNLDVKVHGKSFWSRPETKHPSWLFVSLPVPVEIIVAVVEEHAVESFMLGVPNVDHKACLETAIIRHGQRNHLQIQINTTSNLHCSNVER